MAKNLLSLLISSFSLFCARKKNIWVICYFSPSILLEKYIILFSFWYKVINCTKAQDDGHRLGRTSFHISIKSGNEISSSHKGNLNLMQKKWYDSYKNAENILMHKLSIYSSKILRLYQKKIFQLVLTTEQGMIC